MIICFSCTGKKEKSVEEKLRGKEYKYWLHVKDFTDSTDSTYYPEMGIFYLDNKGSFLPLFYSLSDKGAFISDPRNVNSDMIDSNMWSLKNDSILCLDTDDYIIKELNENVMILYSHEMKSYGLFISCPDSLLPPKYHSLQKVQQYQYNK